MNNRSKRFSTGAWLALAAEVLRVAGETMQPEQVSIWLKTGDRYKSGRALAGS